MRRSILPLAVFTFPLSLTFRVHLLTAGNAGRSGDGQLSAEILGTDSEAGVGYAYVSSQMGARLTGDPRDVELRNVLYSAIR